MSEPIAFLNDRLVPFSQATLSVTDLGVVAGASVTEMIRTFRHVPFRLSDHLDRLFGSLELCGFLTKVDRALVESSIAEVVTHNSALIPVGHDLGIIVFVTAGQNLTYLGSSSRDSAAQGTVCVHNFLRIMGRETLDRSASGVRLCRTLAQHVDPATGQASKPPALVPSRQRGSQPVSGSGISTRDN